MITGHYAAYKLWKNITFILITVLLVALTIIQCLAYSKLYREQRVFKELNLYNTLPPSTDTEQLWQALPEIDKQHWLNTMDALVEIMPPQVKIEKLHLTQDALVLTCHAQNDAALATMLEACSKNSILQKLRLKNSAQHDGSCVFTLASA